MDSRLLNLMLKLAAAHKGDPTCLSPRQLPTQIQVQGFKHTSQSSKAQKDGQRLIRYQVQQGQRRPRMGLQQRLQARPP